MNKEEIQQELQATEAKLAELRAKLDEPERPLPKPGEVWRLSGDFDPTLIGTDGAMLLVRDFFEPHNYRLRATERIGTFDEVFVRRDTLSDEYVSKKELAKCLNDSFHCPDPRPHCVRLRIGNEFEIDYSSSALRK